MAARLRTVYRWEDGKGHGPYVGHRMFCTHRAATGQPSIHEDNVQWHWPTETVRYGDWVCGFSAMSQVTRWFTRSERRAMRERGIVLWRFRIPESDVSDGEHQVAFMRNDSRRPVYAPDKTYLEDQ